MDSKGLQHNDDGKFAYERDGTITMCPEVQLIPEFETWRGSIRMGRGRLKRLTVIVLSGPIGSGKTTLTEKFSRNYEAKRISTSSLISVAIGQKIDRRELQQVGLGSYFQAGQWISDAVKRIAETSLASGIIVVDAARTREQVIELRKFDSELWRILHVPSDG